MHILPTRGRPQILQRYFDEGEPAEPGVVVIDEDQQELYRRVIVPGNWDWLVVPAMQGFVAKVNAGFKAFPNEPWYSFEGDDCVGRSPLGTEYSWDTILAHKAAQGYIAYGDDLFNHKVTHPYIYGDFCRDLGWVAHPAFKHLYVDLIWEQIGNALGVLRYFPDVITEAHHFANGKLPMDRTARERMQNGDHATWVTFDRTRAIEPLIQKLSLRLESLSR